jgi:hypothetical protein
MHIQCIFNDKNFILFYLFEIIINILFSIKIVFTKRLNGMFNSVKNLWGGGGSPNNRT